MEKNTSLTITIRGTYMDEHGEECQMDESFRNCDAVFVNGFRFLEGDQCAQDVATVGVFDAMVWGKIFKAAADAMTDEQDKCIAFLEALRNALNDLVEEMGDKGQKVST